MPAAEEGDSLEEETGYLDGDRELLGTWAYGSRAKPARYSISLSEGALLQVEERLPTGACIRGVLRRRGEWLQANLVSTEGKRMGMMRLRLLEGQQAVLSNIRGAGAAAWGRDIVAQKGQDAAPQSKAVTVAAAELLSKFFDAIEARRPPDGNSSKSDAGELQVIKTNEPEGALQHEPILCETTRATAAIVGNAVARFGYIVNKLEFSASSSCMVCSEDTHAGAPLLAVPVAACWSAEAVARERPAVSTALQVAAARNPRCKPLVSKSVWMALHLLHERRLGDAAAPHRQAHLGVLPEAEGLQTLLVWSDRDLESLRGSHLFQEARRRKEATELECQALLCELGPELAESLGLNCAGYRWARHILQQFAMHFLEPGGTVLQLLVPGLELLQSGEGPAPGGHPDAVPVARVGLREGVVEVRSARDLRRGDRVFLSLLDTHCPSAVSLLRCGEMPAGNVWDYAEVVLRFPVERDSLVPEGELWRLLAAIEEDLSEEQAEVAEGDCLPFELVDAQPMVRVIESQDGPEVVVRLRLSKARPLPDRLAMAHLGLLVVAHPDRLEVVLSEEAGVVNPLGIAACERRALIFLRSRIEWALEEGPSDPDGLAARLLPVAPRRAGGLRAVAAERRLLAEALEAISERLVAPQATACAPDALHELAPGDARSQLDEAAAESHDEGASGAGEKTYSDQEPLVDDFYWCDGRAGPAADEQRADPSQGHAVDVRPPATRPAARRTASPSPGRSAAVDPGRSLDGATWKDLASVHAFGFSLPALCEVVWRRVPAKLPRDFKTVPKVYSTKVEDARCVPYLVQLPGCRCPEHVREALHRLGGRDCLSMEGGRLRLHHDGLLRGPAAATVEPIGELPQECDVLVVPLLGRQGSFRGPSAVDLADDFLLFLQALLAQSGKQDFRARRVVILTSGSLGPSAKDAVGAGLVPAAAPLLGMVRALRMEAPQVPVLWIDTDVAAAAGPALAPGGRRPGPGATGGPASESLLEQLRCELGLTAHARGPGEVSGLDKASALLASNFDVAYRGGDRWLPKVELSPRMPLYVKRPVADLPRSVANGAAVVTGGTGGIGFLAAEALAEAGARCIVLTSQSGALSPGQGLESRIEEIRRTGAKVLVEKCDSIRDGDVQLMLEGVRETHGPLKIVVHASGLLVDKPIAEQDDSSVRHAFGPKAQGAWNLHRRTLGDDLHAFIMFSSVAALFGSAGQSNYAVASTYVDELARLRVGQGLPAVSVQWPVVDLSAAEVDPLAAGAKTISIGTATVKQVVKQILCGAEPIEPVQAVLPVGYLATSLPWVSSMLEPLVDATTISARGGGA